MLHQPPAAVRTDSSNAFAHHTMTIRVPGIIKETITRNPDYPLAIRDALLRLHDDIQDNAFLSMFEGPAPDYDLWADEFESRKHESWLSTEWLFAELFVYRLIVNSVSYWTTLRDPFEPFKEEELGSSTLWNALGTALDTTGTPEEQLSKFLEYALWGNRMDLSLKQAAKLGTNARDEHLLDNHIPAVVDYLLRHPPGTIHFIMDNAGTEQALDLVLVDHLLNANIASKIVLHVKMQPVLVSDSIVADVHTLLERMKQRQQDSEQLALRLEGYINEGRLSVVPDFFWNTSARIWELPARIRYAFQQSTLVISKGDLNYRRSTNDALWPADATLSDAIGSFPAPFLALRTLKSDTLVGINQEQQDHLETHGEKNWRTSGAYGVAQFVNR